MIIVIIALCIVIGVGIRAAFVHPVFVFIRKLRAERERRELIEVARAAAARYEAERKAKKYADTRGGRLAAERDWRGA